jgi:hypothetical protein
MLLKTINSILLVSFFVLPRNENLLVLTVGGLLILGFFREAKLGFSQIILLTWFVILNLFIICINLFWGNSDIEYLRIVIFCFAIYFFGTITAVNNLIIVISIFYLVLIQVLYALNFDFITNFVDDNYPVGEYIGALRPEQIKLEEIVSFRLAGLFHNPNEMGIGVLVLFLIYRSNKADDSSLLDFFLILICLLSILATGSRSVGFVFLLFLFVDKFHLIKRWAFGIIVGISICVIFYSNSIILSISQLRLFSEFNSIQDNGKQDLILNYISYLNHSFPPLTAAIYFIFGRMNTSYFIDSEVGFVFQFYGLIGVTFYSLLLFFLFQKTKVEDKKYLLVFLLIIGATVFIHSYLIFPVVVLLSIIKKKCADFHLND